MAARNIFAEHNIEGEKEIISSIVALKENLQHKVANLSSSLSNEYHNKFSILDEKFTEDMDTAKKHLIKTSEVTEESLKLPNIEYDGRTSLDDFLEIVNKFANKNGWKEQEKVGYIISALRGPAAEVLLHLNDEECFNYAILVHTVRKKHETYVEERRKVAEFFERKQMPDESVEAYGTDVNRLGNEVLRGVSDEILNFYIVKQFLVGLANTKCIDSLLSSKVQFNNIDQAIEQVVKIENANRGIC